MDTSLLFRPASNGWRKFQQTNNGLGASFDVAAKTRHINNCDVRVKSARVFMEKHFPVTRSAGDAAESHLGVGSSMGIVKVAGPGGRLTRQAPYDVDAKCRGLAHLTNRSHRLPIP